MEAKQSPNDPNQQQSWSGAKRTHSRLKNDSDDMQIEASNTIMKMTKFDDADANPTKTVAAGPAPVHGAPGLIQGQLFFGARQPQILPPGQGNMNSNVA